MPPDGSRLTNRLFSRLAPLLVLVFFFLVMVVPNSFRFITLPLFFLVGLVSVCALRSFKRSLIAVWLLSSLITMLYLGIGVRHGYPAAIPQVIFVYVVSPFIWIMILSFVFSQYSIRSILRTVLILSFIGAMSVPLFVVLFSLHGPNALTWLIKDPNLQFTPGSVGVTMHVLAPLAFVVAGFFSCPRVVHNSFLRFIVSFVLVIAVVISGRSALFVSLFIGIFSNFLFDFRSRHIDPSVIASDLFLWCILGLCAYWLSIASKLDLTMIFHGYLSHILEMGGQARVLQAKALIQGIYSNHLLGSGHGVGVEISRNSEFPWRYELFYLATLYRVGLIGFVVYSLPVFFVIRGYLRTCRSELHSWLNLVDRFVLIGFIATIIICGTNPYLESFDFQWMFWAAVVYFINRKFLG